MFFNYRVWESSSSSLITKSAAKYKTDLLSMGWVHHGGSDNLVSISEIVCHWTCL